MRNEKLYKQITENAGNVFYTYVAHWNRVDRFRKNEKRIKVAQIILTSVSTFGFFSTLISEETWLSLVAGIASAVTLALNLFMLNFDIAEDIKLHTDAANDLWDVREAYKSLMVDFDALTDEQIRMKRDELTLAVGRINKKYPGTDEGSFSKAQKEIGKYTFDEGEAEKLLNQ